MEYSSSYPSSPGPVYPQTSPISQSSQRMTYAPATTSTTPTTTRLSPSPQQQQQHQQHHSSPGTGIYGVSHTARNTAYYEPPGTREVHSFPDGVPMMYDNVPAFMSGPKVDIDLAGPKGLVSWMHNLPDHPHTQTRPLAPSVYSPPSGVPHTLPQNFAVASQPSRA